ncbi:MAG: hypothetical protein OIF40_16635 [Mangrovicoccus sp.]|nr:hypothetical protein [Mangrovicoccus sp.]
MGHNLARNTSDLLKELASDCDHIQVAIGKLLQNVEENLPPDQGTGIAHDTLRDLQGLDRISQLLRDVAAVQHALSESRVISGDSPTLLAVDVARLEETRTALAGRSRATYADEQSQEESGDCQFF